MVVEETEPAPVERAPGPAEFRSPVSIWFRLAGGFGALFCMTAIAWATAGLGDQSHPMKTWLGRHGVTLIVVESVGVFAATLLGMCLPEADASSVRGDRDQ